MQYVYIALIIFAVAAAAVPAGMILFSKLFSPKYADNDVKNMNYESGEEPIGEHRDITNDYLAYFPAFLAFEMVSVIAIIWSLVYSTLSLTINEYALAILVAATLISILITLLVQSKAS